MQGWIGGCVNNAWMKYTFTYSDVITPSISRKGVLSYSLEAGPRLSFPPRCLPVTVVARLCNSGRCSLQTSPGMIPYFKHRFAAATVAIACCPPLPMNSVLEPAIWVTLMCLPAIIRFETLREYRLRKGIS
jgi:hypothetical protein